MEEGGRRCWRENGAAVANDDDPLFWCCYFDCLSTLLPSPFPFHPAVCGGTFDGKGGDIEGSQVLTVMWAGFNDTYIQTYIQTYMLHQNYVLLLLKPLALNMMHMHACFPWRFFLVFPGFCS